MSRPSALSVLPIRDPAWRAEFDAADGKAQAFAQAVPLVRVVVTKSDNPYRARRAEQQVADIFASGVLRPAHESDASHAKATKLGSGERLYFHAGRTHPDYGRMAFVFEHLAGAEESAEATPFGLGGLLCDGSCGLCEKERRQCTSPVAHDPEADQKDFVQRSTWDAAWRKRMAEFCAAYFGPDLASYFAPLHDGKPCRPDPASIYTEDGAYDWRSWTVEIRVSREVELRAVLEKGGLLFWAIDPHLEEYMTQQQVGGKRFSWWEALTGPIGQKRARKIEEDDGTVDYPRLYRRLDREVMTRCLV